MRPTRHISWLKPVLKDFEDFPAAGPARRARHRRRGAQGDNAKPLKGFDSGVFEVVLRNRGDAFRVVYAVQIGADLWVVHAFQKKSKTGIKTPRAEIDLIHTRLKRLKELLK